MLTIETTFDCAGKPNTVATARNAGESIADFATRHKGRVARAKEKCDQIILPLGTQTSAWTAALGAMLCAAQAAYPSEQFAADVDALKQIFVPI